MKVRVLVTKTWMIAKNRSFGTENLMKREHERTLASPFAELCGMRTTQYLILFISSRKRTRKPTKASACENTTKRLEINWLQSLRGGPALEHRVTRSCAPDHKIPPRCALRRVE